MDSVERFAMFESRFSGSGKNGEEKDVTQFLTIGNRCLQEPVARAAGTPICVKVSSSTSRKGESQMQELCTPVYEVNSNGQKQ